MVAFCLPVDFEPVVCFDDCLTEDNVTPAEIDAAVNAAAQILHQSLGRKYGRCPSKPLTTCFDCCESSCCCSACSRLSIVIPNGIDVVVTSASYTYLDELDVPVTEDWLAGVRTAFGNRIQLGDHKTWPRSGDFTITWESGLPYPPGFAEAVGELATQFLKARCGSCSCDLPSNVTSMVRGDIAYTFQDAATLQSLGLVGLPLADALVRAYGSNRMAIVSSPDLRYGGETGGAAGAGGFYVDGYGWTGGFSMTGCAREWVYITS